jgi:hypothetical protein
MRRTIVVLAAWLFALPSWAGLLTGAGTGAGGSANNNMYSVLFTAPNVSSGPSVSATNYSAMNGGLGAGVWNSAVAQRYSIASMAGHISNLHVEDQATLSSTQQFTISLYLNGSAQTLSCQIGNGGGQSCNDTSHTITIAQGDKIAWQSVPANSPTGTHPIGISAIFYADNGGDSGNYTPLFSSELNAASSTSAVGYVGVGENNASQTTEANASVLFTAGGTVDRLCVLASAAPGAAASGKGWNLLLRHNGSLATNSLAVSLLETATQNCSSTGTAETIAAGDTISVEICPLGNALTDCNSGAVPASATIAFALRFSPTATGQQPLFWNAGGAFGAATKFVNLAGGDATGGGGGSDAAQAQVFPSVPAGITSWTMGNYEAAFSTDPGAAHSRTMTMNSASTVNGTYAATSITCTMSNNGTITYQGGTNPGCADASHTVAATTAAYDVKQTVSSPAAVTWAKAGLTVTATP